MNKAIITCALTGVLTDPKTHPVPVTAKEMAQAAREAFDEGASVLHCHFRSQDDSQGHLPTWDPDVVEEICNEIRTEVPEMLINMSTGVIGKDIDGPVACLERVRPEIAALNAGSLNYLRTKKDGTWAWKPMIFDNSVEKISAFLEKMNEYKIVPECECFDTGIVRSLALFQSVGLLKDPIHASFVMGVASGMPAKASWLPLLIDELPKGAHWQTIAIGRKEVWELHRETARLGGHLRSGLEDTFYLPNGDKARSNGPLIKELAKIARDTGREVASPGETKTFYGITS